MRCTLHFRLDERLLAITSASMLDLDEAGSRASAKRGRNRTGNALRKRVFRSYSCISSHIVYQHLLQNTYMPIIKHDDGRFGHVTVSRVPLTCGPTGTWCVCLLVCPAPTSLPVAGIAMPSKLTRDPCVITSLTHRPRRVRPIYHNCRISEALSATVNEFGLEPSHHVNIYFYIIGKLKYNTHSR